MKYNFDEIVDRKNTSSYKWDQSEKLFGNKDILPLWVADMDFKSPAPVVEAMVRRAEQGIYGYTIKSESYLKSISSWFSRRHNWEIQAEWITDTPGIVPALSIAVECFTNPGDQVILQSPVYYPFYDVIKMNNRIVAKNPLLNINGRYEMDYEHLEQLMVNGAKLLLLCNPHNPGGRVWSKEELVRLGDLCMAYDVTVISDEIHCDHTYSNHKHTPFASISEPLAQITLTCLAPTKSFNIPGIPTAFVITANHRLKQKFDLRLKSLSLHMVSFFTPTAVQACYNDGEEWLDQLLVYLEGNAQFAMMFFHNHLPELRPMKPEGTYLLWVDCNQLQLDAQGIKDLMFHQAGVAFSEGSVFGTEGAGFLRINFACPRLVLQSALEQFREAIQSQVTTLSDPQSSY